MQAPKLTMDTYGFETDFQNKPYFSAPLIISVDARNRGDENPRSTPASFDVELRTKLTQIRQIELRDGFITLPEDFSDPYILLFFFANGVPVSNATTAGPVTNRGATPSLFFDAADKAFAQLLVQRLPGSDAGIYVSRNMNRRILIRFVQRPLDKIDKFHILLTDMMGVPLQMFDERTDPTGTDRTWLQFEVLSANV